MAALFAPAASAHLQRDGGIWVYRYYTHSSDNPQCDQSSVGRIDPLNILYWQYGEAVRIHDHSVDETEWRNFGDFNDQVTCVNPEGNGWSGMGAVREEDGHGCLVCRTRAHLRIFPAGHVHSNIQNKWSTADVHHESPGCCFGHEPDESWETWENQYANEMKEPGSVHNIEHDKYDRVAAGLFRGQYDNGDVTRVGGLHNDAY